MPHLNEQRHTNKLELALLMSVLECHKPVRSLRSSSDVTRLATVKSKKCDGDGSFAVFAPRIWNMLPVEIRSSVNTKCFKKALKTYMFLQCY